MGIESVIYESEVVDNTQFTFGETTEYYPAFWHRLNGNAVPVMFTRYDIMRAANRAAKNDEDMPARKGFLQKLFFGS